MSLSDFMGGADWRQTVRAYPGQQVANCKIAWICFILMIIVLLCFCCSVSSSYLAMYLKKDSLCNVQEEESV
jgi:hypothetical protein